MERRSPHFKTLRFRQAIWNAVVVFATAAVTLIAVRQGVKYALISEMDDILREDLHEIILAVREEGELDHSKLERDLTRKAKGHRPHGWFAQLYDGDSHELWHSENTPDPRPVLHPTTIADRPTPIGHLRIIQKPLAQPIDGIGTIRVGCSQEFVELQLAQVDFLTIQGVIAVLIAAPLIGYFLAGLAIRPLARITDTASRLQPNQLEDRLPIRGTGDELDRLSKTINGLLDRIARYLQQKQDFLSNSAHELRGPLAAIRSSIEVALISDRSREEYESLLNEVIDESASLETLVNQLLLLAETSSERLRVQHEHVPLDEIVRKAVSMFDALAESKLIKLTLSESISPPYNCIVAGNQQHLRQLINNLLDNAIKFTPGEGRIEVILRNVHEGRQVELTVTDSGMGIPESDLPNIFDRFFRGDKSRERHGAIKGTGLGLSICEAIVTEHGGTITVRSQVGHGTTFTVLLPVAKKEES